MMSFESVSSNNYVKYIIYALVLCLVIYLAYMAYTYIASMMNKNVSGNLSTSTPSNPNFKDLDLPTINGSNDINDSDFDYIAGTSFNYEGLSPDPSNDVQKYKMSMDATGRPYWEPLPMTSANDYLSPKEFDSIVERHVIRNMTPNLRKMTEPKFIRNADNFWGVYWPNETGEPLDNGRCVDPSDLKTGIFQNIKFGEQPAFQ